MAFEASKSPPAELEHRVVTVQASVVNTVEIPCDPRDPDFSRWFDTGEGTQPLRRSNHVTALVDGDEAFAAMADAIDTAGSATDYIYMTNWWVDLDFELRPAKPSKLGAASTKLGDLLTTAVANGVQVRALYWDQVGSQNAAEAKRVNKLDNPAVPGANGGAILDDNTLNNTEIDSTTGSPAHHFGSHHQKILIVKGTDGLTAFCGGIDFNTDRVFAVSRQPGSPMHDVHCQIEGPAAFDVLNIFIQRWTDHPDSPAIEKAKGALRGIGEPVPPNRGDQYVQIGRTYGNGAKHSGIKSVTGNSFYTFASSGEMTAKRIIFKAIEQASRFIYVEDQYLVSMEASNKLLAQLPKIQKLVVLIPHPSISDHPHIWKMTKRFIDNLKGDPKLVVCYRKPTGATPDPKKVSPTAPRCYVHAKMWIMDDKFAVIGSANCGRRSYTHDSEVVAGIFDESKDKPCTVHFAHDLRMRLWADHLNMKAADVFDPIGSSAHWFKPPLSARIAVFDQNADTDSSFAPRNLALEDEAEPDGS